MQVSKITFTAAPQVQNQKEKKQSSLYNKQNFMQMGAINDFIIGSSLGFGILESRDKFKLLKKENVLANDSVLKQLAKKHTKRNVLIGLGVGTAYALLDFALMKKFDNKIEAMYDKLDELKANKKVEK